MEEGVLSWLRLQCTKTMSILGTCLLCGPCFELQKVLKKAQFLMSPPQTKIRTHLFVEQKKESNIISITYPLHLLAIYLSTKNEN